MRASKCIPWVVVCLLAALVSSAGSAQAALTPEEQLGKLLFFDATLSTPDSKSCAGCHSPAAGFAEPDADLPVCAGINKGRLGARNSPTINYCAFTPDLHYEAGVGYVGGWFWDGRAQTLISQPAWPLLNPLEMNNPSIAHVARSVREAGYADQIRQILGPDMFMNDDAVFQFVCDAIIAYERSSEISPFTSKYDYYLKGLARLTSWEQIGLWVFENSGGCTGCHPSTAAPGEPPLFTNHTYHNLGVPQNPDSPYYLQHPDYVDYGLGGVVGLPSERGKMKVPTLRNVALTAPYTHNGNFARMEGVIKFLSTRDLIPWPAPEVGENVDTSVGSLGLADWEIKGLLAFLETLSDGYVAGPIKDPPIPDGFAPAASGPPAPVMTLSPNPFNPVTRIECTAPGDEVRIAVYDVSGRLVRRLADERGPGGARVAIWDGTNARGDRVASGVYFVRLDTDRQTVIKKAVLMR